MKKTTCLECYRLTKKTGSKVTCARCVMNEPRRAPRKKNSKGNP